MSEDAVAIIAGFIVVVFLIFVFGLLSTIRYSTTTGGSHSGYVTAVQQSGIFFKNYRVYFKTDNSSSQEDTYCIQESDKELADTIRKLNKERKLVEIHYEGVRGFGWQLCLSERIISVE